MIYYLGTDHAKRNTTIASNATSPSRPLLKFRFALRTVADRTEIRPLGRSFGYYLGKSIALADQYPITYNMCDHCHEYDIYEK